MSEANPVRASRAIGAMFVGGFGALWLIWGCLISTGDAPLPLILVGCCGVVLLACALSQYRAHKSALAAIAETPEEKKKAHLFNLVNFGQWGFLIVGGNLLAHFGYGAWIAPMAILVVGLHFLPLAIILKNPTNYLTGTALVTLALTYPVFAGPNSSIGQFATGFVLWATAIANLWARPAGHDLKRNG